MSDRNEFLREEALAQLRAEGAAEEWVEAVDKLLTQDLIELVRGETGEIYYRISQSGIDACCDYDDLMDGQTD